MNNKTIILATVEHLRKLLILTIVAMPLWLQASHIVGGEFELIHKENFIYTVRLIVYFDVNHGNPGARDTVVTATIYRKSDNRFMMFVRLFVCSRVGCATPVCLACHAFKNHNIITIGKMFRYEIPCAFARVKNTFLHIFWLY